MNKKEFIDLIAEKANLSKKDADIALQAVVDSLTELLAKGDSIVLPGFASISVKKRAARSGRNPSTGKPLDIPASNAVSFKAGIKLKEAINQLIEGYTRDLSKYGFLSALMLSAALREKAKNRLFYCVMHVS